MISAIVSFPDSFDFPIFRSNLSRLRLFVDEIVICFTKHGNYPMRDWFKENMPYCTFLNDEDARGYPGDWRNKSTNLMIDRSNGDWILSLEPDFFIRDYSDFFLKIKEAMQKYNVITFYEGQRFHPAFLLVKRGTLNNTSKDFSVQGTHKDHFWLVSKDLKGFANYVDLPTLGLKEREDWFHMGGLTENYHAPQPYYRLPEFYAYNEACMKLDIPFHHYWKDEMERCSLKEHVDGDTEEIKRFL